MKKAIFVCAAVVLAATFAVAQSSGNFTAQVLTTACSIDQAGNLTGGLADNTIMSAQIQTPNSGSTALLIRPSLVTGLYTNTKLSASGSLTTATATAGLRVFVTLDGKPVAPDTGSGVIFDERFQQLSTNLLTTITECTVLNPDGTTSNTCYLDLLQSTLSAHSFDFVAPNVGGGNHSLKVWWELVTPKINGVQAACAGPGVLTVEQVKNFNQSGLISIQ
jgi:hypothetical protein